MLLVGMAYTAGWVVFHCRFFSLCRVEWGHLAINSLRLLSRFGALLLIMYNFSDKQMSHFLEPVLYDWHFWSTFHVIFGSSFDFCLVSQMYLLSVVEFCLLASFRLDLWLL